MICTKCNINKDLDQFYKQKGYKNGINPKCKSCNQTAGKIWSFKNKGKKAIITANWRKNNPENYKIQKKRYNAKNKDKNKNYLLGFYYGISLEEYNLRLKQQNHTCAICKQPETERKNKSDEIRDLAVDHCHKTGKVRGLLCGKCNKGIGSLRENPEIILAAASYVVTKGT